MEKQRHVFCPDFLEGLQSKCLCLKVMVEKTNKPDFHSRKMLRELHAQKIEEVQKMILNTRNFLHVSIVGNYSLKSPTLSLTQGE